MHCLIKYIFHNCFVMRLGEMTLLFDYPAPEFLSQEAIHAVQESICDTELYIFSSHSHGDHFSPNVIEMTDAAKKRYFIVAKDVAKACPSLASHGETLIALPGREESVGNLSVEAFLSNDQGVAFLIGINGKTVYFGGDLANWNWENDEEDRRLEAFFKKTLDKLVEKTIDIVFSNADPRLANWSGAYEVIEKMQPRFFIPMHTFGQTEALMRFKQGLPRTSTSVWTYDHPGMNYDFQL